MKLISNAKYGEPVESGTIFRIKENGFNMSIHKICGCGDTWYLNCSELGINDLPLKNRNLLGLKSLTAKADAYVLPVPVADTKIAFFSPCLIKFLKFSINCSCIMLGDKVMFFFLISLVTFLRLLNCLLSL